MNYLLLNQLMNEVLRGEHDARFQPVIDSIHCMSRPRVYAVLNAILASMDVGETYLEVGTYQGGSLVSATLGNPHVRAVGVDSFEEFQETNNFQITQDNLNKFGVSQHVTLHNMSFYKYFEMLHPMAQIQVYYYDGAHGYEVQLEGMEAAWKFLAPDALIVVDDYTYPEVVRAVNQFMANHLHKVKPMFVFSVPENNDPVWWNGAVVLQRTG
jgi:predicted O-methyltransferase YrrM